MQNFHNKSILLGMGMGVVLTSIISMIYFAGLEPKMSREDVIKQAEKYGMVQKNNLLKADTSTPAPKNDSVGQNAGLKLNDSKESAPNEIKPVPTPLPLPEPPKPVDVEVIINVNKGDTSEIVGDKIAKAGLINDKSVFVKEVISMGLSNDIDIGEYRIKKGTEVRDIIKIVTRRK